MQNLIRFALGLLCAGAAMLGSGCTTAIVVMHVYDKMTEGDPAPCRKLNSVDRALQARCGAFVEGSLQARDVAASNLPQCPLVLAARDPAFWPVLPELLAKGAQPAACAQAPWVALAQALPCPDFAQATPAVRAALRRLALADERAIHHDVLRVLSCPAARAVALDGILDQWQAQGRLQPAALGFGALGALHPSHLGSPLARALEDAGHRAEASLGPYAGKLAPGFEEALREGDLPALDWWFARLPALRDRVPPAQPGQLAWVPLARVLTPSFMPDASRQRAVLIHLIARGADPQRALPHDPGHTVIDSARQLGSPLLEPLERAAAPANSAAVLAVRSTAQR